MKKIILLFCSFVILLSCGIKPQKWFVLQEDAVNLVGVPYSFPEGVQFTPEEQRIYELYGKPDYFYIWYDRAGTLTTPTEAHRQLRTKKPEEFTKSWIYEDQNLEITIRNSRSQIKPISDKIKILSQNGDPEFPIDKFQQRGSGTTVEIWQYRSMGRDFRFHNNVLHSISEYEPMGTGFRTK